METKKQTKARVTILTSDKIDFKNKAHNKRQGRTQQFYFWAFIQRNSKH